MKEIAMQLIDAIAAIEAQDATVQEHHTNQAFRFSGDYTLQAGDCHLTVPEDGFDRLCQHLGAPPDYLRDLNHDLRTTLVQHHLDKGGLSDSGLILISRENRLVGFARPDLC